MAAVSCLLLPRHHQEQSPPHCDQSRIVNARESGLAGLVEAPIVQGEAQEVVEGTLERGVEEAGVLGAPEVSHYSTVGAAAVGAADIAHAVEQVVERVGWSAELCVELEVAAVQMVPPVWRKR